MVDALAADVRYAVRVLRGRPWVTTVVVLTLALGIGANTAIFSFIDAILLRPLPYPAADRIVGIFERRPTGQPNPMSTLNYLDYARQSTVFEQISATTICCGVTMLGGVDGSAAPLAGLKVSASYFNVFGAHAAYGRTFAADEDQPARNHVVVLSHRVWAARFGSDPTLVGRSIVLDDHPYTVIGVMPENSPFDRGFVEIWIPVSFEGDRLNRSSHWLLTLTGGAVALLKPGVTVEHARAEMDGIAARLSAAYPDTNKGWGVDLEPYASFVVPPELRRSLYLVFAAVALMLLITCVNVANMMLAWALARDREVAVRLALGATPWQLTRQFLTESLLLSMAGGVLGVLVGYGTMSVSKTILAAVPATTSMLAIIVPADASVQLDARVLSFTLIVSVLSAVMFGLAPALPMRGARRAAIASGYRATATRAHQRLRNGLVVAQIALAFVLLTSAGLLIRSVVNMGAADTGFDATNVLTVQLSRAERHFENAAQLRAFMRAVVARLRAVPGVQDAAFVDGMPMNGAPRATFVQRASDRIVERAERPIADLKIVGPAYFHVLGLRVRRGRTFGDADRETTPLVAVINETMARTFFANSDGVGQRLLMDAPGFGSVYTSEAAAYEVVGVIADERLTPFDDRSAHAVVYVSNEQDSRDFLGIVMRSSLDARRLEPAVRVAVAAIDRGVAVTHVQSMDEWVSQSTTPDRFRSILLAIFAAVALALSAIGIYGMMAYAVVQRTHEFGIRAAIGASRANLIGVTIGDGVALAAGGLAIGAVGAIGATRFLQSFLSGVGAWDVTTWAAAAALLAIVAVAACYLPAREAASVDPVEALRKESW